MEVPLVETYSLGALATNAHVVFGPDGSDCWVFDCPDHPEALIEAVNRRGSHPRGLFLTHAHGDHMAGVEDFRRAFPGVPVAQHPLEASWLQSPELNLSAWYGAPATCSPAEVLVTDGHILSLGPWAVRVLHVPGHSPGSVAYWFETAGELIAGDVLFRSGVGRWDFPGSDQRDLRRSLERLCTLPDGVRVRPGHGGATTIGREKTTNPYLRTDEAWE